MVADLGGRSWWWQILVVADPEQILVVDPGPSKKALRVALTRCGTLSQNGYGAQRGAMRAGSFPSEENTRKKRSRPDPQIRATGHGLLLPRVRSLVNSPRPIVSTREHDSGPPKPRYPDQVQLKSILSAEKSRGLRV